ncbi:MAG: hypothetical protein GY778_16505, partial [bacterium]|nr:hypothetical protein [bacterium]
MARVLFVPEGTDVGPTFAVRQPAFETVPVPAGGDVALCGGKVRLRVRPDGRPPHRDNLELHWTSGGVDRSWRPGDLDHENLGAPFLALDNLWRDYIPRWVRPADPMVGFDRHIWNTAAFTLAVEAAMTEAAGKAPTTEQRNAEVRRVLEGSAPGPEATGLNEWPEAVRTAREVVRHSPPGLLSRSGLTIFRDDTAPWNPQTGWIGPRPDPQPFVFYLIYHDCDWKLAARESASLLGPIPYVPAYLLGVWYSNYSALG